MQLIFAHAIRVSVIYVNMYTCYTVMYFFDSYNAHMDGQIWFLTRSLQLSSFQAYKLHVTHLYQLKQHNILVSVGEDEQGINPLVRILEMQVPVVKKIY